MPPGSSGPPTSPEAERPTGAYPDGERESWNLFCHLCFQSKLGAAVALGSDPREIVVGDTTAPVASGASTDCIGGVTWKFGTRRYWSFPFTVYLTCPPPSY